MTNVKQKSKMGRPVTIDADRPVGLRLPRKLVGALDKWANDHRVTRSEAVRQFIEQGLARKVNPGSTDETITQVADAKLGGAKAAKSEPSFRQLTNALKTKGKR